MANGRRNKLLVSATISPVNGLRSLPKSAGPENSSAKTVAVGGRVGIGLLVGKRVAVAAGATTGCGVKVGTIVGLGKADSDSLETTGIRVGNGRGSEPLQATNKAVNPMNPNKK